MAQLSDYLEAALLNHLFRGATSPRADTYYIALFTTATNDAGGGTEVSTGDWTNYARAEVNASSGGTIFTAAVSEGGGGHATDNGSAISYGTATTTGTVTVTHLAVMTAPSGGNMLYHGALSQSKSVQNGDPVEIPAEALALILR